MAEKEAWQLEGANLNVLKEGVTPESAENLLERSLDQIHTAWKVAQERSKAEQLHRSQGVRNISNKTIEELSSALASHKVSCEESEVLRNNSQRENEILSNEKEALQRVAKDNRKEWVLSQATAERYRSEMEMANLQAKRAENERQATEAENNLLELQYKSHQIQLENDLTLVSVKLKEKEAAVKYL